MILKQNEIMITRSEIEKLKRDWCFDPCWDIEETPEFEDYYHKLFEYRQEMEAKWKAYGKAERDKKCANLGIDGNYKLLDYLEGLEKENEKLSERIWDLEVKNKSMGEIY